MKFLLACLCFFWLHALEAEENKNNFEIAVFLDLTGPQSSIGQQAMNGFLLAIKNAPPQLAKDISIKIINTESNLELTKTLVKEVSPRLSAAAGFTDNSSVLASGNYFQENRVPFLSIGATDPQLPAKFGNIVYLVPFGDNEQALAAADFSKKTFGGKGALVWDSTTEYTVALKSYFEKSFASLGGRILFNESFPGGCSISELGKKLHELQEQPDFLYLAGLPECIGSVIKSLRDAGATLPIIGGDGLDTPELVAEARNNVWYTTHAWLGTDDQETVVVNFMKAYKNAYQTYPKGAFTALGYDAGNLLLQALFKAKNSKDVANALNETEEFPGVTGTISYSKESHVPKKPVWILQIKEGKTSLAEKWQP